MYIFCLSVAVFEKKCFSIFLCQGHYSLYEQLERQIAYINMLFRAKFF